jgi:peptidoglycan hydrolase-like protein with peptidoglycan-binding domain
MRSVRVSLTNPDKRDIGELQAALIKLRLPIAAVELRTREFGESTRAALRDFQAKEGIDDGGRLTAATLAVLNQELEHTHFARSKTRAARIHKQLTRLGYALDPEETRRRIISKSTEQALADFRSRVGIDGDHRLTAELVERLESEALAARLKTKSQVAKVQRILLRCARIAKLEIQIDPAELKRKELGATSKEAIRTFQKKYKLKVTGKIDPATMARLQSVAASRRAPVKTLKDVPPTKLAPVNRVLRLNMTNRHVGELQQALAFLGHIIDQKEFNARKYGRTTRKAVVSYQRARNLPVTGHANGSTLAALNREIARINPESVEGEFPYRLRGSVRDGLWRGRTGVKVQLREKVIRGVGDVLAERPTLPNGFYDIPYDPPRDPIDGQIKSPFHLEVVVLDQNDAELERKVLFNPTLVSWVNFTEGSEPYLGSSEFEQRMRALTKVLRNVAIASIEETDEQQEISHAAINAGLPRDDVMRLAIAHRAAADLNRPPVGADVFYAFLRQNLPASLPSDLLGSTEGWTLIDQLVDLAVNGVVFMEPDLQDVAFQNAVAENLVPIATGRNKEAILDTLGALRESFALEKPILIGNGNLKLLLDASAIQTQHYTAVATAFLEHRSLGDDFWEDVRARPDDFGGADAVADLETTINLGEITKNHLDTVAFLKGKIDDPQVGNLNSARDLAKVAHSEWVQLIQENGGAVPPGTDGETPQERIEVYAGTLAAQSERLFPSVAFAAEVGRGTDHQLTQVPAVQQLLDDQPELDLRSVNLDKFAADHELNLADDVLGEARVMQRVHRITPTAEVGRALLDNKIHSAVQILTQGKERFVTALDTSGIDRATALTIFGQAEFQHAQALARLTDLRAELLRTVPRAIATQTLTREAQVELLGDVPTLEVLFGSLDTCDCGHCQSVIGPAAYMADLLRFLEAHPAEEAGKTVRDILFERRPDIGNIKLNCDNTETPLPYVDLVCEILEALVPPNADPNIDFQTTRPPEELRAFPENVRKEAYHVLKQSSFPMNSAFDLWQEEARIFLNHLGVPRHELMETFQARPSGGTATPSDVSIAGEYWTMSSHETDVITSAAPAAPAQGEFWGFDATVTSIPVSTVLDRAAIEYRELLGVLAARWVNPTGVANRLTIERPSDTCSTDAQTLTNLTRPRLDRMHRFLRLSRHVPWSMWELDLLLRADAIGNGTLDEDALVRLMQVRKLQERLRIDAETAVAIFDRINDETRTQPDDPQKTIPSLYDKVFQNKAVTNPVDPAFSLPLAAGPDLADHRDTLIAALAITEADLAPLLAKTDGELTVENLTVLFSHAVLARGLGFGVADLLSIIDLVGIDPFASPAQSLELIDGLGWIAGSGLPTGHLDYLLTHRPEAPYGPREEVLTQQIEALRESLRSSPADGRRGQIVTHVAATFSLTDEQADLLLGGLALAGPILAHFEDPDLTAQDADGAFTTAVTPANFPRLYESHTLLQKAAMLVNAQSLTTADLEWLLANHAVIGGLNLSDLPVTAPPAQPLFEQWLVVAKFLDLRARFPEPEGASFTGVLDLAANSATDVADIEAALSALATWPVAGLEALRAGLQLQHSANSDYTDVDTYLRLRRCFQATRRLGVDASVPVEWALRDDDTGDRQFESARQIRGAAKSKYDSGAWLSLATPMQDELREKKRTALVRYLVELSQRTEPNTVTVSGKTWPNLRHWHDANDLLGYALIDAEMNACQLTSRIKQAISSTQMFVQRCFLNLEQPDVEVSREELEDTVSLNSWKQWRWMKSYRIWEANRKVFLYPENWIEPELRDDKSPFFVELENELLQTDMSDGHAEAALLRYVEKVHEVSRLTVTGIYHEVDDDHPWDNLPPSINVAHVVARTRSQPAVYYYRRCDLNYNTWTPWERIDLEIAGDHLIPVVYNRKLHLFWLVFTEKPIKVRRQPPAEASSQPTQAPDPPSQLEIQLAWSVRTDDGWSSRKLSRERIIHPWQRPLSSYNLKPRYKPRENMLWLDIYLSTSRQFNNALFYDPYRDERSYVTAFRYDETARPWHSSSFLFDGNVVDIKLKGLRGQYRILEGSSDALVATDSHRYVQGSFGEAGRETNRLDGPYEIAPRLALPTGMHFEETHLANNTTTAANPSRFNVLEAGSTVTLLQGARSPFELVFSQHDIQLDTATTYPMPLVYQDAQRSYFIKPEWRQIILGYNRTLQQLRYTFYPFYHPYTALFIRELNRSGLEGLLNRRIQLSPHTFYPGNGHRFTHYAPTSYSISDTTAGSDIVDFSFHGAYSTYNWELFFHAPLMIACKLSQNQRFEEALRWFHFIFDPTNTEAVGVPQRFWVTKPFYEQNADDYRRQRIEGLLENIGADLDQLRAWKNNPFKPHLIARYRPVAYQKNVVMKYIDNLTAWGDQLFRRDTIESINEATTLYVLAAEILGPRPRSVPNVARQDRSYNELVADGALDPFGNKKVEVLMENLADAPVRVVASQNGGEPMPNIEVSYFGIPDNDHLIEYWDRVDDRLFKIRHCMNIQGIVRQLPLFEPPIDPAVLVKAAAAGVDLGTVLTDMAAPPSQYRFRLMVQQAQAFCADVKVLGEKLLSVLEKQDAEGLALLRSANEVSLLHAAEVVRKSQIKEAAEAVDALERAKALAEAKQSYYTARDFINAWEGTALTLGGISALAQTAIAVGYIAAGGLTLIPKFVTGASGFGGSPHVTVEVIDGYKFSRAAEMAVQTLGAIAGAADKFGSLASTMGGYQRRKEEWAFQGSLAGLEIAQVDEQLAGAAVRVAIAEKELANHQLQIEQSLAADEYLHSKYTNKQLYGWMVQQLTTVYFQSYQLAYDMAKRAERSFSFELGDDKTSFIQFGYWDGLKKGLLAGERLANDLRRLEAAWYVKDTRTFELTKHVSLAQVNPLALVRLKETGACDVTLPEWLFDLDYPGHIRRRIKSVSLTVPCVVGPYTGVNCTLSLTNNGVRVSEGLAGGYGDPLTTPDHRFVRDAVPIQSIATSSAQNDAGVFELNFEDERYLPFEGAGAVSQWRLDLPVENNQFDFATISDVVMHVRYEAEAGGPALVTAARDNLNAVLPASGVRLLVVNHEFAGEWQRFLSPAVDTDQELSFTVERKHLPFAARHAANVRLARVDLIVESGHAGSFDVELKLPGAASASNETMPRDGGLAQAHHLQKDPVVPPTSALGTWNFKVKKDSDSDFRSLQLSDITEAYLIVRFTTS